MPAKKATRARAVSKAPPSVAVALARAESDLKDAAQRRRSKDALAEALPMIDRVIAGGATYADVAVILWRTGILGKKLNAATLRNYCCELRKEQRLGNTGRQTPNPDAVAPVPAPSMPVMSQPGPGASEVPASVAPKPVAALLVEESPSARVVVDRTPATSEPFRAAPSASKPAEPVQGRSRYNHGSLIQRGPAVRDVDLG